MIYIFLSSQRNTKEFFIWLGVSVNSFANMQFHLKGKETDKRLFSIVCYLLIKVTD
jgi:hypothetical protein